MKLSKKQQKDFVRIAMIKDALAKVKASNKSSFNKCCASNYLLIELT